MISVAILPRLRESNKRMPIGFRPVEMLIVDCYIISLWTIQVKAVDSRISSSSKKSRPQGSVLHTTGPLTNTQCNAAQYSIFPLCARRSRSLIKCTSSAPKCYVSYDGLRALDINHVCHVEKFSMTLNKDSTADPLHVRHVLSALKPCWFLVTTTVAWHHYGTFLHTNG